MSTFGQTFAFNSRLAWSPSNFIIHGMFCSGSLNGMPNRQAGSLACDLYFCAFPNLSTGELSSSAISERLPRQNLSQRKVQTELFPSWRFSCSPFSIAFYYQSCSVPDLQTTKPLFQSHRSCPQARHAHHVFLLFWHDCHDLNFESCQPPIGQSKMIQDAGQESNLPAKKMDVL